MAECCVVEHLGCFVSLSTGMVNMAGWAKYIYDDSAALLAFMTGEPHFTTMAMGAKDLGLILFGAWS